MSVKHCLVVVLLLCLCFLSCDARRLRTNRYNHVNSMIDEKNGIAETLEATSKVGTAVSSKFKPASTDKIKSDATTDIHIPKDTIKVHKKKEKIKDDQRGIRTSTKIVTESFKSVSKAWKVPHKTRHSEEHPSFNLDYMQPVTHPPHHN